MGMGIVAKSRREAVKMFGLVLKHYGILKYLGGFLCCVKAVLKEKSCSDTYGQCFKLWDAEDTIYAECFMTPQRVRFLYFSSNIVY